MELVSSMVNLATWQQNTSLGLVASPLLMLLK